jgi:hypothetical protein
MISRSRIPFSTRNDTIDFQVIADNKGNSIYLLRRGDLTSAEDPERTAERVKARSRLAALYLTAVKNYQQENRTTRADAETYFIGDEKTGRKPGSMYDYMTTDEIAEFQEIDAQTQDVPVLAATLFLKHRCLFPVVIKQFAGQGANQLYCDPIQFEMPANSVIRCDGRRIVVTKEPEEGATMIEVRPLGADISEGSVAFLMEGRSEKIGIPEWTFDDTWERLTIRMQNAIAQFYQQESQASEAPDAVEGQEGDSEIEGKDLLTMKSSESSNTPLSLPPTGENSSGESKSQELETAGSTKKTSGTSRAGS